MKEIIALIIFCSSVFITVNAQTVGMKITSSGDVGIGTSTPVEKLDIDGAIRVGNTTSANAGTIRWNGNCFEGYDGSTWLALSSGCGGSSGPIASCSDGIQNQGETGVDCGGPCSPCSGGGGGCINISDVDATRPLPNLWWNNEINVGGTALTGDGELYFTIDAIASTSQNIVGLNDDPNFSPELNTINYGIFFYPNVALNRYWFIVKENGLNKGSWTFPSSSIVGSVFSIERTGTSISYKRDGVVFYTSTTSSTGDLFFDNSFYYPNSGTAVFKLTDISLCPPGSSPSLIDPTTTNLRTLDGGQVDEPELAPEPVQLYEIELASNKDTYMSAPTPNPFSDRTTVTFAIGRDYFDAELVFSDNYGRELGRQQIESGQGVIEIDAADLDSGVYQYSLLVDGEIVKTNKMVVVK